jgi:phosphoribosylformylglycinamidine cyclo-ligase
LKCNSQKNAIFGTKKDVVMSYEKSGVDTKAADNWVEGIQNKIGATHSDLISGVGDYAAVYKSSEQQWIATSCDGIGTKILWGLEGFGSPKGLAQDLVAMNVNDLLCTGATPKLFLDYLACSGKEALKEGSFLKKFITGLIEVCQEENQILAGGETAQMPDLYQDPHFDVAGFSVGFLSEKEYIHPTNLKEGLQVYGWTSSGPHSNGFTWLRKLFSKNEKTEVENLMAPTRIYIKDFLEARKLLSNNKILSAFHITGSGLENLLRSQNTVGFHLDKWPTTLPAWASAVKDKSGCNYQELFSTFNCGMGFIFVTQKPLSPEECAQLKATHLGHTTQSAGVKIPHYDVSLV